MYRSTSPHDGCWSIQAADGSVKASLFPTKGNNIIKCSVTNLRSVLAASMLKGFTNISKWTLDKVHRTLSVPGSHSDPVMDSTCDSPDECGRRTQRQRSLLERDKLVHVWLTETIRLAFSGGWFSQSFFQFGGSVVETSAAINTNPAP